MRGKQAMPYSLVLRSLANPHSPYDRFTKRRPRRKRARYGMPWQSEFNRKSRSEKMVMISLDCSKDQSHDNTLSFL
jgi:ribosomal protein L44E